MKGRTQGYTFLTMILLSSALFAFLVLISAQVEVARRRVLDYKGQLSSKAMARSGLRYARAMLAQRRWLKEGDFDSPEFPSGRFRVEVRHNPRGWLIHSVGRSGSQSFESSEVWP